MGLISDILESNRERVGQLEMATRAPIEAPPAPPPRVACPVCDRVFRSDLGLNNHIARDHAQKHVYLKANGQVVRSIEVFAQKLRNCEIILVGAHKLNVTIRAGSFCKTVDIEASTNLSAFLPSDYIGEVEVIVNQPPRKSRFLMFFATDPPFDTTRLNAEVTALQRSLEYGIEPNWNAYQRRQLEIARNGLEKTYLDGFFEYTLGFQMEKQERWRESGTHLERAMHLLRPYSTPLARIARRILAIRMNCFAPLRGCHRASHFYLAYAFFVRNVLDISDEADIGRTRSEECLYVDGFTERLLLAIRAFYARDFVNLLEPLEHLGDHPLAADTNNEHKLLLLKARTARVRGDQIEASRIYQLLLDHPLFGNEAEGFLNDEEGKTCPT